MAEDGAEDLFWTMETVLFRAKLQVVRKALGGASVQAVKFF